MPHFVSSLPVALLAAAAAAQSPCFQTSFGTPLGTAATLTGDVELPGQPLGFAFPLGGSTYTDVHITDKGYVWLTNAGVPATPGFVDYTATAAELAAQSPRIAALWSDFQALAANGAQIWLDTSAPGRAVITWEKLQCFGGNCSQFDMQLHLHASGEVFVFWGPGATNNSDPLSPAWQVGVTGVSPGGATLPAESDLSASSITTAPMVWEEFQQARSFDMASRGLQLVPTNPGWLYTLPAGCAGSVTYGDGCVRAVDSIHEEWLSGFDLSNTTVSWLRAGSGYLTMTSIPGTIVPPSPAATNVAGNVLDGFQVFALPAPMPAPGGPVSSVVVTTKGQILLTSTGPSPVDYTPTVSELLADPATVFALWHDYDQTSPGSGAILWEQVGPIAYATWNGVHSFGGSVPNTFQFQLHTGTGDVTLVIGSMGSFGTTATGVLGYSVAGPSPDPGPTDFSALSGVVSIADVGSEPLVLAANSAPRPGNATYTLETSNVPNLVPLAIQFFGTSVVAPPVNLAFLGMPDCFAHSDGQLGSVTFPVVGGEGSVTLPIPANPALVGSSLTTQSVAFSTATPFGLVTSNGLQVLIGN